jgi:hypothetical protein
VPVSPNSIAMMRGVLSAPKRSSLSSKATIRDSAS